MYCASENPYVKNTIQRGEKLENTFHLPIIKTLCEVIFWIYSKQCLEVISYLYNLIL